MGGRDSVHYLWIGLQDAVDIKSDWNGASVVKLPFCFKKNIFYLKSPFSEYFIGFLDKSFHSPLWIFSQRPDMDCYISLKASHT